MVANSRKVVRFDVTLVLPRPIGPRSPKVASQLKVRGIFLEVGTMVLFWAPRR